MGKYKCFLGVLAVIVLSFVLIWFKYAPLLHSPNQQLLGQGLDGFKNYFTPIYHIKYDSTYHRFTGMNYPFGEHVVFTDNQPIIANAIKWISNNIVDISGYTIGILNILMFLSWILSAVFLYLIFQKLKLPVWYSVLVALGIAGLSPQILRLTVHYALSYMFAIPMLFYLILLFEEKPIWIRSVIIAFFTIFVAQIHFYYFGLAFFFLAFYFLYRFLKNGVISWQINGLHWAIQALIPFLFLNLIWLKIENPVIDRPNNPYGFFFYNALWEGFYFSPEMPWYHWIDERLIKIRPVQEFESWVYAGVVAFLFSIFIVVKNLIISPLNYFFKFFKNEKKEEILLDFWLKPLFFAGLMMFLLSLGLPFIISKTTEYWLNYTGPFKQFRGIGRFAWVFYYALNIVAFYRIYSWINQSKYLIIKVFVFLGCIGLLFFEVKRFNAGNYSLMQAFGDYEKTFEDPERGWLTKIDYSKYQAVLPLPYYHIGSENFWLGPEGRQLENTLLPTLYKGIPSLGVFMSRTSVSQSLKSIQMAIEPYRMPEILKHLPNQKPLLVVVDKATFSTEKGNMFRHLLTFADSLYENKAIKMYELPLNAFAKMTAKQYEKAKNDFEKSRKFTYGDLITTDSTQNFIYKNFNDLASTTIYRGKGAFTGNLSSKNLVYVGDIPNRKIRQDYKFTLWVYVNADIYPTLELKIREVDPKTGAQLQFIHHGLRYHLKTLDNGWALFEVPFQIWHEGSHIECSVEKDGAPSQPMWVDELLIRPASTDIYFKTEKIFTKNNRWYSEN